MIPRLTERSVPAPKDLSLLHSVHGGPNRPPRGGISTGVGCPIIQPGGEKTGNGLP